ncbi:MAG TPA: ABC transporter permease [Patescibacteria group bacterium]
MNTFFADWFYLSIRNIKQIWRPLLAFVPNFFIPIFFFATNAVSFQAVSKLPGFPTDSYLNFIAPTAIFTSVFFATSNIGIELVLDIASGYFKKLTIMPVNRLAIILARLSEAAVLALIQGSVVLILVLLLGVKIATGFWGVVVMFLILMIFAMGWSCIGLIAALRTQNPRMVQSLFILVFPFQYLTTSQMPIELLPRGFAMAVKLNPVTYILEATRSLMLGSWSDAAINQGLMVAVATCVIMVTLTLLSYRKALK